MRAVVDGFGHHGLSYSKSTGRLSRLAHTNGIIHRASRVPRTVNCAAAAAAGFEILTAQI